MLRTLSSSINALILSVTYVFYFKGLLLTFLTPELESSKLKRHQSITNFNDMNKSVQVVWCQYETVSSRDGSPAT